MSYKADQQAGMKIQQRSRSYRTFKDDLAVIDGIIMKGRCITIMDKVQKQAPSQLHSNFTDVEKKTRLMTCESIY